MAELTLLDTTVPPGGEATVRLPIAHLPTGTLMELPVHIYCGQGAGPVLLLQGGLHGDELNGVESLRRMMEEGTCRPDRGAVLVAPVINLFGFLEGSRELPDGKDINRSFPGSARGSLAARVAHTLLTQVFAVADVVVDLHTGGGRRHNHPQVRFTEGDAASEALSEVFGAPFRFASRSLPRSLRREAFKRGVPMLVFEGGESLRFDESAIQLAIDGAQRVMVHLGMVAGELSERPSVLLSKPRWIRAPRAGLFQASVSSGAWVRKGEVLGRITDPYNHRSATIKAPRDGFVVSINHMPLVHRGDAVLRLGAPVDGEAREAEGLEGEA